MQNKEIQRPEVTGPPVLLSQRELAHRWSISRQGVGKLVRSGEVRAVRLGGRVLVSAEEARRFETSLATYLHH